MFFLFATLSLSLIIANDEESKPPTFEYYAPDDDQQQEKSPHHPDQGEIRIAAGGGNNNGADGFLLGEQPLPAKDCKCEPPQIANAGIIGPGGDTAAFSVRKFTCSFGYRLFGSNEITCTSDGIWEVDGFCSPCPFVSRNITVAHRYFKVKGRFTWDQALQMCQDRSGARLAHIKTQQEQEAVRKLAAQEDADVDGSRITRIDEASRSTSSLAYCNRGFWIGGHAASKDAPFVWIGDNSVVTLVENWANGQPDYKGCRPGPDYCMRITAWDSSAWDDLGCAGSTLEGAICEYESGCFNIQHL